MTLLLVPAVALVLVAGAVGRYRRDIWAALAGVAAALAGTLGVTLALPEITLTVSSSLFATLAVVAIVVAVGGTIIAETRIKRVRS